MCIFVFPKISSYKAKLTSYQPPVAKTLGLDLQPLSVIYVYITFRFSRMLHNRIDRIFVFARISRTFMLILEILAQKQSVSGSEPPSPGPLRPPEGSPNEIPKQPKSIPNVSPKGTCQGTSPGTPTRIPPQGPPPGHIPWHPPCTPPGHPARTLRTDPPRPMPPRPHYTHKTC